MTGDPFSPRIQRMIAEVESLPDDGIVVDSGQVQGAIRVFGAIRRWVPDRRCGCDAHGLDARPCPQCVTERDALVSEYAAMHAQAREMAEQDHAERDAYWAARYLELGRDVLRELTAKVSADATFVDEFVDRVRKWGLILPESLMHALPLGGRRTLAAEQGPLQLAAAVMES
jgi:hypothetical protein